LLTGSQILKVRHIASTLLEHQGSRRPRALRDEEYITGFLTILTKLERDILGREGATGWDNDTIEVRDWADLKDFQSKLAHGGYAL
jgi:hypothetical protein